VPEQQEKNGPNFNLKNCFQQLTGKMIKLGADILENPAKRWELCQMIPYVGPVLTSGQRLFYTFQNAVSNPDPGRIFLETVHSLKPLSDYLTCEITRFPITTWDFGMYRYATESLVSFLMHDILRL